MRAFRFYAILLAMFLCGCAPAFAQFGSVSNLVIKGGFTPGYTTENDPGVTNGTIRWNPNVTALQVRVGAGWTNLAAGVFSGGLGGSYSQTPWTSNVSGGWFDLSSVAIGTFSNVVANRLTVGQATMGSTIINGNLTVNGTLNRITEVTITTNYYVNTGTTYVHTTIYATSVVYATVIVYTNTVSTNRVDTYINLGGDFTMGGGSTFNATGATTVIFPYFSAALGSGVTTTGAWDFSGATVTGLDALSSAEVSSIVSNVVFGQGFAPTSSVQIIASNAANAANAVSVQGLLWVATTPGIGSVPYYTGAGVEWTPAPPATSTGSVLSVNGAQGNLLIEGEGAISVTESGGVIRVRDFAFAVSNDANGKVGYSTGSDFITWEGASAATGSTLHLSFESADDLTNFFRFNFGSYTAEVVRGRLLITAAAESVDQTRALGILNPATNSACFMTAKLIGSGAVGGSANQQYGIGMGVSMTNSWRQMRLRQTAGTRHFRGYDANLTASAGFATGGTGAYPADPSLTLETATIEQFPVWVGADHDGVLTLRYFVAKDNGYGQPARWLQIGSKTNATPGSYWGLVFASPTYSQGAPSWIYDDFTFTSGSLLQ